MEGGNHCIFLKNRPAIQPEATTTDGNGQQIIETLSTYGSGCKDFSAASPDGGKRFPCGVALLAALPGGPAKGDPMPGCDIIVLKLESSGQKDAPRKKKTASVSAGLQ
jgi:hypothetical protein